MTFFHHHRFRSRGVASNDVAAALNFVFGFITKNENVLQFGNDTGTALFYCVICGIGLRYSHTMYVLLETEGHSLEEIELHFA